MFWLSQRSASADVAIAASDNDHLVTVSAPLSSPSLRSSGRPFMTGSVAFLRTLIFSPASLFTNGLYYNGLLDNGADPSDCQLLRVQDPKPNHPACCRRRPGHLEPIAHRSSHSNPTEAQVWRNIVQSFLAKHVPAASVKIITFYKEQYRLMEQYAAQQGVMR
ncbi:hypothetical protein ANCDUO_00625 [Ancylostoma duodenale]|uniref:DNA2/NAM7 helicase-like C-terminal domain-containing protein n=1 Tax=Ancylostoma duodenale TaxID=51022 RepID=A0A0C2HBJ3_9BILA|nr:hypothetical protein ANCDUO_00625 [Ancylostoma duodenale]